MGNTQRLGNLVNGLYTDASGNVGIGTTSPTDSSGFGKILDLNGSSASAYYTRYNSSSTVYSLFGQDSTTTYLLTKTTPLSFYVNNAERMRITTAGNVGIGTTSPVGLLQLNGAISNSADAATFTIKQSSTSYNNGIYIERASERTGYFMYISSASDALTFRRNWVGTQSDVMVLTRDGNVGVGITPTYLLDVANSSSPSIRVRNGALGGTATLLLETANDFSGTCQTYIKCIGTTSNGTSQLAFGTAGASGDSTATERMRITGGGYVAINATNPYNHRLWLNGNLRTSGAGLMRTYSAQISGTGGTFDIFRFLDDAGNVIASGGISGILFVNAQDTNTGGNQISYTFHLQTNGNGTAQANITQMSYQLRGNQPLQSISLVNDGSGGAVKVTGNVPGGVGGCAVWCTFVGTAV